jgi:hypothetical protein
LGLTVLKAKKHAKHGSNGKMFRLLGTIWNGLEHFCTALQMQYSPIVSELWPLTLIRRFRGGIDDRAKNVLAAEGKAAFRRCANWKRSSEASRPRGAQPVHRGDGVTKRRCLECYGGQ